MGRKLVTLRRISAVRPIPKADQIEVSELDGWQCVTKKGEFHPGDVAVFFEIDSFLPALDPRWAFLAPKFITSPDGKIKGFRVKTIKMRGQISQGLALQLAMFPEISAHLKKMNGDADADVDDAALLASAALLPDGFESLLGVTKFDAASASGGWTGDTATVAALGPLPDFIPRTDQERAQNLTRTLFAEDGDNDDALFQETTKMDGSSMTVYCVHPGSTAFALLPRLNPTGGTVANAYDDTDNTSESQISRIGVCSRNVDLVERPGNLFWDVALRHNLHEKLRNLHHHQSLAIQGELCGSSIQSNFEGFARNVHEFFIFSAWDVDAQRQLPPREVEALARELGLCHVPVSGYFRLRADLGVSSLSDLLARAEGTGVNGKKREGVVYKREDGDFSFKVISNSYLLKHGE